jgi:LPXTG-motif cell wall-anchored protein
LSTRVRVFTASLLTVLAFILGGVGVASASNASSGTEQISAKALTDHALDTTEWHFVITSIDSTTAPASITVTWANGQQAVVGLDRVTGGTAHYTTTANLDSTVVSATAIITTDWDGQFNLSHGPRNDVPPTTTEAPPTTEVPPTTEAPPTTQAPPTTEVPPTTDDRPPRTTVPPTTTEAPPTTQVTPTTEAPPTTKAPTTTAPAGGAPATVTPPSTGSGSGSGPAMNLPVTGSNATVAMLGAAVLLIIAGALLLGIDRKRLPGV